MTDQPPARGSDPVGANVAPAGSDPDLRAELRALGYLDARVDRFVLGAASTRSSARGLAASASIRIGMLAAVMLGPAAAIGLAANVPGLVTSTADAMVLAAYLGVFVAIATTVAALLAIALTGSLARRRAGSATGRRGPAVAGTAVAIGCLAYFALWWRAVASVAGGAGAAGTAGVAAVAVSVSLLLGRAVSLTARAAIARAGAGRASSAARRRWSWALTFPLALVAAGGMTWLLLALTPGEHPDTPPPTLTVVSTNLRVVVIAIDGVDLATVARLRAEHRLPTFDRLLGGAHAPLAADPDADPARVWTTIATGQPPDRNGVHALETREIAGVSGRIAPRSGLLATLGAATDLVRLTRPSLASGNDRRLPTFWEVAARAGLRTAVIHWWATWPAADGSGIVISDRALLRLEHGGPLDAEIAPASLYDTLRSTWAARRAKVRASIVAVTDSRDAPDVSSTIARSADLDATLADVASDPVLGPLDLRTVYLPGLDIAQHALLDDVRGIAASEITDRAAAIERYYVFLDGLLARLAPKDGRELAVLVATAGRVDRPQPGVVAISGPGAGMGTQPLVSPTAVAGTILYALGVPVATDLAGAPLISLFDASFARAYPLRTVATYGQHRVDLRPATGQTLDQEMIDRMRSLGYVK